MTTTLRIEPEEVLSPDIRQLLRTASGARRRAVATLMLGHLLEIACSRGYERVSLETGSDEFFAPARQLYRSHGFIECPPFADYSLDPHSVFMTLCLGASPSS